MAWWDYGYWITALGNRTTLADNGTQNTTQIAMIAQMFMRNETTAVPMMRNYNIDYVMIFVTYARTQGQSSPTFIGAGEDGKWYWMVRIANQTSYGDQTILFQAKRTGNEVNYDRVLEVQDKIIANDTISSGQQLTDNSVLGFLMNTGVGLSQGTSAYFDRVFTSSNNFVLVYKVLYPTDSRVTVKLDKGTIRYGEKIHIDGTASDTAGNPYATGRVALQYLTEGEAQALSIATVDLIDGKFSYDWLPPAGNHTVRAFWVGVRGESKTAVSDPALLFVEAIPVTLTISLSNLNVTRGENVTVLMNLSEELSNGTLTLEYSANSKTWNTITAGEPKNGTLEYTWAPLVTGTLYVRATYSGSGNYGAATSVTMVIYVKP
jgi:hypothetical protein